MSACSGGDTPQGHMRKKRSILQEKGKDNQWQSIKNKNKK